MNLRPFPYSRLRIYGICLLMAVVFIIQSMIPDIYSGTLAKYSWQFNAVPIVTNYFYWALLAPLVYALMPWLTWQKGRAIALNLMALLVFGPALALLHSHMDYWTFMAIYQQLTGMEFGGAMEHIIRSIYANTVRTFVQLWVVIGSFAALDYYRRFQQHQMRLLSAEKDLADARLTSLRMQLNPHFLFNAFNSVISLIDINKDQAKDMLSELSSLMRHMLKQDTRHTVTLAQEIEFNRRYLDIEAIRFADRLSVELEIDPQADKALVPNLILQPMVENAIKHGFSQTTGDCTITIRAKINGERLHLEVADNGKGCGDKDVLTDHGVGVGNIKNRLEQMFGDDFDIEQRRVLPSGFQLSLQMPYIYSTLKQS